MKKLMISGLAMVAIAFGVAQLAGSALGGHHEIKEAIESLRSARGHLDQAGHDFGGHREAAMRAIDNAIEQLELARKFDKD